MLLDRLKGKYLDAAARLQSDPDYAELMNWLNAQSTQVAISCARENDVNMTIRLQGAFQGLDELVEILLAARKDLEAKKRLDENKRNRQAGH